jgi:K+-sensing histidine kinase KdpD
MYCKNHNLNVQIQTKLIEVLTQSNTELKLINSFAKYLHECKTINDILNITINKFENHKGYKYCSIYLLDKSESSLILENTSSFIDKSKLKKSISITQQNNLLAFVTNTGKYANINNLNRDFENNLLGYNSRIVIPLLNKENEVIGMVDFRHPEKNYFKMPHKKTLTTITSFISTKMCQITHIDKITKYQNQLEDYAHIVSHDLKSPLRSINALISWIKEDNEGNLNESTITNIDRIDTVLSQMENLISSTLEHSKIDYTISKKNDVDLNILLNEIKEVIFIPENITLKIQEKLPKIYCEKIRISQIFQNIIDNAIKYNDKEKGEITITFAETLSHYQFSIKDNGKGIESKYHKKIFEIFQSLETIKQSSGIGLSIVKKQVNYFQGELWLESKENIGSTFYFTIKK